MRIEYLCYNQKQSEDDEHRGRAAQKIRVRYLKCSKGELHEGQVLNFICIDPACKQKGLICPVCQSSCHQGHQTLHLKMFLAQVGENLGDKSEIAGLGGYLASLDQSRREMTRSLRETVEQLSHKIREVEEKIDQTYTQLRRIVLSQSTVSLRLPELYRLLTETSDSQDESTILKEISRYSQLLEFKDNKLIVVDSSSALVTEYESKAGMLAAHLTTVVAEVGKIFAKMPLSVDRFGGQKEEEKKGSQMLFSSQLKSPGIKITDGKTVSLEDSSATGIAFVDRKSETEEVQRAAFKVTEGNEGDYIQIGVASPQLFKEANYEVDIEADPNLFGLCSFGILSEDLQGEGFIYSKGDTVDVTWDPFYSILTLSRRHSIEKCEVDLSMVIEGHKNLSFFVALLNSEAKIELVE